MKKVPKKKNVDDDFKRIQRRNWVIFAVALVLFLFFAVAFPLIQEVMGENNV